jgi:hypothetical protein
MKSVNFKVVNSDGLFDKGEVLAIIVQPSEQLEAYQLFKKDSKVLSKQFIRTNTRNAKPKEIISLASHLTKLGIQYKQINSLKG